MNLIINECMPELEKAVKELSELEAPTDSARIDEVCNNLYSSIYKKMSPFQYSLEKIIDLVSDWLYNVM